MSHDLQHVFASAGVDLKELQAVEHAARARVAHESSSRPAQKINVKPPVDGVACRRCGASLREHEEYVCDACDRALSEPAVEASSCRQDEVRGISPQDLTPCWPRRHCNRLQGFHGPALEKARALLPMVMSGGMLLLHGPQGRGKTGMATWWEWQRRQSGEKPGCFGTVQGVFGRIRASWTTKNTDEVLRELAKAPYLVLDEMDERANSEWEEYTLFDLINSRYNDELTTVMISNLTMDEITKIYKPKFLSRISESGGLVPCQWESYR